MNNLICLMTTILIVMVMLMVGGGQVLSSTCTCKGDICYAVTLGAVDFQSSKNLCQKVNGELMTVRSAVTDEIIGDMLVRTPGNFWIGLRLLNGRCSNTKLKMRGYEWTTGIQSSEFSNWKDNKNICVPQCVSVSNDRMWTERPCQDKIDGCLCENVSESACQKPRVSSHHFYGVEGCDAVPCEHKCKNVPGGYECSCFDGYIPSRDNPHFCEMHCSSAKCPAICDGQNQCICPDGFIKHLHFCEDINECDNDYCEHYCYNTVGSFFCSCKAGYSLQNVAKCVKTEIVSLTIPVYESVTPRVNNTSKVSSASTGSFFWIGVFIAAAVTVGLLIITVRYYVIKNHEQNLDRPIPM
ncbi:thrombomodulin [Esox lucius]|uniref:Thrombomodulin n=1 Tax=Esox lucius TaxID=8010 RepID=A0AAY5KIS8_ESOLU|nr:thrombomodulin [Esox lucius]